MQEPVPGISAVPDEQNARYFHVVVAGKLFIELLAKSVYLHDIILYRTGRFAIRGRSVQTGVILARGLSYVSSQSAIYH